MCIGNPEPWLYSVAGCLLLYCFFGALVYASLHGVFKGKGKSSDDEQEQESNLKDVAEMAMDDRAFSQVFSQHRKTTQISD